MEVIIILATIYIPNQEYTNLVPLDEALARGSSFENLFIPYKFIAAGSPKGKNPRQNLLALINMYGFLITDLTLYKITHPNCTKTNETLKTAKMELEKLTKLYNENFSPLNCHSEGKEPFHKGPWPWEDLF